MLQVTKFSSAFISGGIRFIKILSAGFRAARTAALVQPFGEDSNPVSYKPLYAQTENESQPVIIGFINPNAASLGKGEKKIFSTNESGSEQFYIMLKNDNTCEFGGDADNLVRFSKLESGFNSLKDDFNSLVQKYNTHFHTSAAQGRPTTTTTSTGSTSSASISAAKIEEIKTL